MTNLYLLVADGHVINSFEDFSVAKFILEWFSSTFPSVPVQLKVSCKDETNLGSCVEDA